MLPGHLPTCLACLAYLLTYLHTHSPTYALALPSTHLLAYPLTHSPAHSLTQVRATLHNVGARAAAETAQLYLGLPAAAGAPPRQLKGFVKRFLQPGERNRLSFALSAAELAAWNATSRRVEPVAGEFAVFVGTSSRTLPLGATFVQAPSGLASLEPVEADRTSPHRTPAAAAAGTAAGPGAALAESQPLVLAEQQRVAVEQAFGPHSGDEAQMQMQMPGMAPRLA